MAVSFRIRHIHMRPHKLHAVGCLHPHRLHHPAAYILPGELLFALAPALNALKERSGVVPVRLPRCQAGVQVDMGLNKRREHQLFPHVHNLLLRQRLQMRRNLGKPAVLNPEIRCLAAVFNIHILNQHKRFPPVFLPPQRRGAVPFVGFMVAVLRPFVKLFSAGRLPHPPALRFHAAHFLQMSQDALRKMHEIVEMQKVTVKILTRICKA